MKRLGFIFQQLQFQFFFRVLIVKLVKVFLFLIELDVVRDFVYIYIQLGGYFKSYIIFLIIIKYVD